MAEMNQFSWSINLKKAGITLAKGALVAMVTAALADQNVQQFLLANGVPPVAAMAVTPLILSGLRSLANYVKNADFLSLD